MASSRYLKNVIVNVSVLKEQYRFFLDTYQLMNMEDTTDVWYGGDDEFKLMSKFLTIWDDSNLIELSNRIECNQGSVYYGDKCIIKSDEFYDVMIVGTARMSNLGIAVLMFGGSFMYAKIGWFLFNVRTGEYLGGYHSDGADNNKYVSKMLLTMSEVFDFGSTKR